MTDNDQPTTEQTDPKGNPLLTPDELASAQKTGMDPEYYRGLKKVRNVNQWADLRRRHRREGAER